LLVTIGLGAFIISTLNVVEESMLAQVEFTGQENQSNTILFDIQREQKDGVVKLMQDHGLKVNQVVPIITCRLQEVKGKTVESLTADTTKHVSFGALTREYRITYRDTLSAAEELIEGKLPYRAVGDSIVVTEPLGHMDTTQDGKMEWVGQVKVEKTHKEAGPDSILVTVSDDMAERLEIGMGDSLVFDMQGVPMKVRIGGIRKVDWPKDPPNFIFVFPTGVLEDAPQIYVTATRITDPKQAAGFQQALIEQFPNVSLIDLQLILSTVNDLFNKLGLVIRFLALFSILTGLIVLAGAVINSKFVRMKENVLLRTLGARTRQITLITLIEYAWLGLFSALTGMILSLGGGWLLATFFFEITFAFNWVELLAIGGGVTLLTVAIGWFNSRSILNTPPLRVLRGD
jgi:putative ABC transport system permease protein